MYQVFTRNWWKENTAYPNGLEPDSNAERQNITQTYTEEEAREYCQEHNNTHAAGRLSNKAEYQKI